MFFSNEATFGGAICSISIVAEGVFDQVEEILKQFSSLSLFNNSFMQNVAFNTGGALYLSTVDLFVSWNNTYLANSAEGQGEIDPHGGAIYWNSKSTSLFRSEQDVFIMNKALQGGRHLITFFSNPL